MNNTISLTEIKRVLVIRTDRIGDLLLTTPLLEILKSGLPHVTIDVLTRNYTRPILNNNPHLNKVISLDDYSLNGLTTAIRHNEYDVCILAYPRFSLAWMAFRAGIPIRIGTAYRWYSFLFTHRVHHHRRKVEKHEADYNLDLLRPFGINPEITQPNIHLTDTERSDACELLRRNGVGPDEPFVVVHPGSGHSSLNWGIERFAELSERVLGETEAKVIVTGIENERPAIQLAFQRLEGRIVNLVGKLTLRELARVISRSELVVTNSTGPMHVATAVGKRVVTLFCPIRAASPIRWGPLGTGHAVLLPPVAQCSCSVQRCREGNCMNLIEVDTVMKHVLTALRSSNFENKSL